MSVYVDNAFIRYGRMLMCHMIADTLPELYSMARELGLSSKWFQSYPKASFPHYDISKGVREKAVLLGAIEVDRKQLVGHMRRIRMEDR
jgi:Protein of unknown function (DUF4031)